MKAATLEALQAARAERRPVVLATRLADGAECLLPDDSAAAELNAQAARALAADRSMSVSLPDGDWFLHAYNPPPRLLVIGAVHIAQALIPFAAPLGYSVTIVDPRRGFATADRFPGVTLLHDWPDQAMEALRPDCRSAVVALTHDPKIDDPGLDHALRSPAFYIGALGSRKTHAGRLARLAELGHDAAALARIRGPVGLNIGAVTAPEIALSIMAQIVATHRGAPIP
jgi:xanthine dehydrogenase accessory factor